jgi:colanic acid biosynthesis glycosyl transferase WcaI
VSRILVWSPNYAPERTGIPPLVTDACNWLAGHGHAVEVVTAHPNYPERRISPEYRGSLRRLERRGDVTVHRSWLRVRPGESFVDKALYELSFTALSAPALLRRIRHADVLVCVVPCLSAAAVSGAVRRAASRRTRLVLWVQDLVLRAASSLDDLGAAARWSIGQADRLERVAFRAADRVVVCSPAFASHAIRAGVARERVELVYNWVDLDRIHAQAPREQSATTRFLYAGNLGYTQGFETLIEAAHLVGDDIELDIVGEGNSAAHVRRLAAGTTNVRVRPPVSDDEYPTLLSRADAHVVVQRGVSADANFPSKIASYLGSGRPVIASVAPGSAAATALLESGGALVVPPESPEALANAMRRLRARPSLRLDLGEKARAYAERHFGRDHALQRLESVLIGAPEEARTNPVSELPEGGGGPDARPTGSGTPRV